MGERLGEPADVPVSAKHRARAPLRPTDAAPDPGNGSVQVTSLQVVGVMLVCMVKWLVCGAVTALICRSVVQAVSRWYFGLLRASPAGGIAPRPLGYIELTGRRNAGAIYASLRVRAASLRTRTKLGEPKGSPSAFPYRNLRLTRGLHHINVSNTVLKRCQPTVFQCRESLSIEGSRLLEGPVFGVR